MNHMCYDCPNQSRVNRLKYLRVKSRVVNSCHNYYGLGGFANSYKVVRKKIAAVCVLSLVKPKDLARKACQCRSIPLISNRKALLPL